MLQVSKSKSDIRVFTMITLITYDYNVHSPSFRFRSHLEAMFQGVSHQLPVRLHPNAAGASPHQRRTSSRFHRVRHRLGGLWIQPQCQRYFNWDNKLRWQQTQIWLINWSCNKLLMGTIWYNALQRSNMLCHVRLMGAVSPPQLLGWKQDMFEKIRKR